MESELALQLARLISSCEKREEEVSEREEACKKVESEQHKSKEEIFKREQALRLEGERLSSLRDIASERQRNIDMAKQNYVDSQELQDRRTNFSQEQDRANKLIHSERVELSGWRDRLGEREKEVKSQEEMLRDAKVKHHERMLKDLSELELKKMRAA